MGIESNNSAPAASEPSSSVDSVNWGDLDVDVDGGAYVTEPELPAVEPSAPAVQAPAQTQTPATPAAQPAQLAVQAPQAPAASPEMQQPQVQQPQQPQVQQPVQPAVDAVELQRQWQAQLESDFAVSQDDALALSTAPETVMPKLAANMYQRVMQDVGVQLQQMMQSIPQVMQQYVERARVEDQAKQEFYGEWPGLSQHHDRVLSNALLVRQANPSATRQQVIEMAGVMTAMALGVDPGTVRKQAGVVQVQAHQRQLSPVQAQIPPRPAGMVPAQGSGVGEGNVFSSFADEDMDWLKG